MENFHERITANYAENILATSTIKSRTLTALREITITPHEDITAARCNAVLDGNLLYGNIVFSAYGKTFTSGQQLFTFTGLKLALAEDFWAISEATGENKVKFYSTKNATGLAISSVTGSILTGFGTTFYDLNFVVPVVPA